jgi:hypothetical protein
LNAPMLFADVIFPVFTVPYIAELFMPWLLIPALAVELLVFKCLYRESSWGRLCPTVLGANSGSWFVGIILGLFLLPSGIRQRADINLIDFVPGTLVWAFIFAFVISVIIEGLIWCAARKDLSRPRLFLATLLANMASYTVLIGGALLIGGPHFFSR